MGVKKIIFHNEKPGRLIICTVLLPVIVMVSWILLALASCRLPEQAFQEINISEKIDSQTGQPVSPQNKFSISTKQVYASVRYSGVKGEDTWRFKWINTGTQETVLDSQKQYSSEKPQSYFEGTVYSSISTNDASKIIAPGTYRVEFYNNDEIKKTATFEIAKPEMQILKIELASSIDSLGNPLTVASQFKQGETLYACIKMDYLIPGNTLRALLKNENGEELIEEEITIDENYYNQSYRWFSFTISPGSRLFVTGNYKVEIFLNDNIFSSINFEVIEKEPVTFNNGTVYSNEDFGFSIAIPDDWSYQEQKNKDAATITLSSGKDIPASFEFTATAAAPLKPYEDFIKTDADNFAEQNGWSFIESKSRDFTLQNKYPTKEIMYLYRDQKGANFVIVYSITEHYDNAFIYHIAVMDQSYGELAQAVYSGMLNSLQIK